MKVKDLLRRSLIVTAIVGTTFATVSSLYLFALPSLVNNKTIHSIIKKQTKNYLGLDLEIKGVKFSTSFSPKVNFYLDDFKLSKNNQTILNLDDLDTEFSFQDIFRKKLIINKILAKNIYVNSSEIIKLIPKSEIKTETKPPEFNIDIYSALLGVKNCLITFEDGDFLVKFDARNLVLDRTKAKKHLHFKFDFELNKAGEKILISADDMNKIYMGNGELHVDNFPINIDKSNIVINIFASRKSGYDLTIFSRDFKANDVFNMLTSNILIPNGKELLRPIGDVKGEVDFDINIKNNKIKGEVIVKPCEFKVIDLLNLPVKVTKGLIEIDNNDIVLKDFEGFYNNKKTNNFIFSGDVKDYLKTCDTKIVSDIFVNDDFFKNYISKMLGMPVSLVGDAGSRLTLTSKNGSLDIIWFFLLHENEGFKIGEQLMVMKNYKTLFKLNMSVVQNILKFNEINYYVTNNIRKGMTPVFSINSNIDMADNMKLLDINFDIPSKVPSEFLNFLAGQTLFKKGTITGKMSIDNKGNVPHMSGEISMDKVLIPSQRMFLKQAKLSAQGNNISVIANGGVKRTKFDFNGYVLNELKLPIIVKNVDFKLDNLDIEKFLISNVETTNAVNSNTKQEVQINSEQDIENASSVAFQKGLIIIENSNFNLKSGKYKDVSFGNINAKLTLDKDGVLNVQSNKFDIAEGISTLKVNADLIKNKYYLRLGVKDVNSDIMAGAILGLPREIAGKAKGLIEINTDETLKLNGDIKFSIDDGSIEKVGYVEYLLKVVSIFRNPLAMISPVTLGDLVNIPDGKFEKIYGELSIKNNVVERINIKSSAARLGSFIVGRYDLNSNDATLRIYTKIAEENDGFAGFLRKLSLNSIAKRIADSGRVDANYYSSEISQIPEIDTPDEKCQIFLTKVDGDLVNFNFLSSLRRIK